VNLVDRFLERVHTQIKQLQLVGITAMYVASKFEDVKPLRLSELVFITDNTYTEQDVLITEKQMLETLDFDLVVPSAFRFLERFATVSGASRELFHMGQYLIELSLIEVDMLKHNPSLLASSALFSAQLILFNSNGQWTSLLEK